MIDEPQNLGAMDSDPEVIAEKKKTLLMHLRLERYKEMATAIGFFLQTFKAEAVTLVSGVGTIVVGWYQIRKWAAQGRAEVRSIKQESRAARASEGGSGKVVTTTTMEEVGVPAAPTPFMADPMSYVSVGLPMVFAWASVAAWVKHKKKKEGGTP